MKKVAILGSSGGNLFNLGGNDPHKLLSEIIVQSNVAEIDVTAVQFIGAEVSMDHIKDTSKARLFTINQGEIESVFEGTLKETNEQAKEIDRKIAKQIDNGSIDGLIVMSVDADGANKEAIAAAARKKIPIVGTGGTGMANVSSKGAHVISTSGTTGTTNRTRAISFVTSLSKHWGLKYRPTFAKTSEDDQSVQSGNPLKRINLRGIMISSMPAFIAMALILALSKIPALSGLGDVFDIIIGGLPIVLAVIAAKQVSDLDEVSIVAGVVAGVLSTDGGIIGGIIAGILAGLLVQYLFSLCVKWRFPMTTVNIVAGGFSGIISGLAVYYILGPVALWLGDYIKLIIEQAIDFNPLLAGAIAGILIFPAIIGGIYHAAILPIVLLEMETTGVSFLGAIDMVALVMVAAGINLANIVFPREKGEAAIAAPGFLINMGFGTFVESAYPFMFSNKIVFGGAILSGGVGGLLVGLFNVRGTAYLPTFIAPFASTHVVGLIIAMLASMACVFTITAFANNMTRQADTQIEN